MRIRYWLLSTLIVSLVAAFVIWGCDSDDDSEPTPAPPADAASAPFTSEQGGTIETDGGAFVMVPDGAVPRLEGGESATVVFSIEADDDFEPPLPEGETLASRVYRFGPEGFNFAGMVTVGVPIPDDIDPTDQEVRLWRINPTTGEPEYFAGSYDFENRRVTAQTYHFSPWFLSLNPFDNRGNGCAWVINNSDYWVSLCVTAYELAYPEVDSAWVPDDGWSSFWAPWDHDIGVTNEGEWWLPQGTYTICVQANHDQGLTHSFHIHTQQLEIDNPAHSAWTGHHNYDCTELTVDSPGPGEADGTCNCTPVATTPVGTGDIQVTLTWFNQLALDLDLWVTDPTGERCYYNHHPTSTGGELDRDNACGNYENGRPENIYWIMTPPAGEYSVQVDWYDDCSNNLQSQSFTVRTVVQGTTRTYTRSITHDATIEVTRFTISGTTATFAPGKGVVDRSDVERPPKN